MRRRLPGPRRWLFGRFGRGVLSDYTSALLLCRLYAASNENCMSSRLSALLASTCLSSRCLTGFLHHWPTAMGSACIATLSTDGHVPIRPASGVDPALCQQSSPLESPVGLNKASSLTYLLLIPRPALELRFQRMVPSFRALCLAQSAAPAICLIRT